MPSIPRFTISQNEDFVLVSIKVPYIRVTSAEVVTDGHDFSFYCSPYLLKLTFPGEFAEEDERCKAVYDPYNDNGTLVAHLPKKVPGEHFADLDLTTKLLQIRRSKDAEAAREEGIEVLESIEMNDDIETFDNATRDGSDLLGLVTVKYGFNLGYSKILANLRDELVDMLEISDPDSIPVSHRRALRLQSENVRFDIEIYLGDYFEGENDSLYQEAMSYKPFWVRQWDLSKDLDKESKQQKVESTDGAAGGGVKANNKDKAFELVGGFTETEREVLSSALKHKEYLIAKNSPEEQACLLVLADILFAYCYDVRLTQGDESNVESASNIARLSAALSWLDPMNSPLDSVSSVIKCCLRRSIILPYLRVWKLSRKVLTDVTKILFLGKRCILKCLLHVRHHFEHTDTHYLLNKLYLDDLCVWLQSDGLDEARLNTFAREYNNAKTAIETSPCQGKEYMGLHLPGLEKWAVEQQQGEEEEVEKDNEGEVESSDDGSEEDSSDGESESEGEEEEEEEEEKSEAGTPVVKEGEKSLLFSVPKALLIYDTQYLESEELAYLDYRLPDPVVSVAGDSSADDDKVQSVKKLLSTADVSKAPTPLENLISGLGVESSMPTTRRVMIEEISSQEFDSSSEGTVVDKSGVQNIDKKLSQLNVAEEK